MKNILIIILLFSFSFLGFSQVPLDPEFDKLKVERVRGNSPRTPFALKNLESWSISEILNSAYPSTDSLNISFGQYAKPIAYFQDKKIKPNNDVLISDNGSIIRNYNKGYASTYIQDNLYLGVDTIVFNGVEYISNTSYTDNIIYGVSDGVNPSTGNPIYNNLYSRYVGTYKNFGEESYSTTVNDFIGHRYWRDTILHNSSYKNLSYIFSISGNMYKGPNGAGCGNCDETGFRIDYNRFRFFTANYSPPVDSVFATFEGVIGMSNQTVTADTFRLTSNTGSVYLKATSSTAGIRVITSDADMCKGCQYSFTIRASAPKPVIFERGGDEPISNGSGSTATTRTITTDYTTCILTSNGEWWGLNCGQ